jgi:hypothetical protein
MVATVAWANYLMQFPLGPWLTWGTPVIALTFLLTELTNQFYGPRLARRTVLCGFFIAAAVSAYVAPRRIATASATAFLTAQLTDITVFARLRRASWWLAPLAASSVASALDTAVFFGLAFGGTDVAWWRLAAGDFACKLALDLGMLLPFRLAVQRAAPAAPPNAPPTK